MSITQRPFGELESGEAVTLFTLKNQHGLSAEITNYGGIIVSLRVPDRDGKLDDIVLGKDSLQGYLDGHPCFGAIVGRVAGRISGAEFTLDGETYQLAANDSGNCLHGGLDGFDKKLWQAEIIDDAGVDKLRLALTDPDGSNGFPGTVQCQVTYALHDDNTLEISYHAKTDQTTPFNPTNHSYFNLKGSGQGDILGHRVQIFGNHVAKVDEHATLLGHKEPVVEDYNDYREPVALKDRKTLETGNADIHYFLEDGRTAHPKSTAIVTDPESGRVMEVFTTEPGVQFYAGLQLSKDGPEVGKDDVVYEPMAGLCLETQDYPDSVHFPEMGDALLRPDAPFRSVTLYRFGLED